ncbi:MAG: hypothetical protein P4L87_11460 [Formivibrio sp.]|nr:hypothetical protein [Formivibrio sp.]
MKNELVHPQRYLSQLETETSIQEYIETFYSHQLRLGYLATPAFAQKFSEQQVCGRDGRVYDCQDMSRTGDLYLGCRNGGWIVLTWVNFSDKKAAKCGFLINQCSDKHRAKS